MWPLLSIVLGLAASAVAAFVPKPGSSWVQPLSLGQLMVVTDYALFYIPIYEFEAIETWTADDMGIFRVYWIQFDWSTDGCTKSPDKPLGFNFKKACHRHDFGYRNYKRQCRFTKLGKERIDKNFKKDMYFQCGKHKATKGLCKLIARLYYKAVKHWGKRNASENLTRNIRSIAGDWKSLGPAIAIEHKLLASGGLHGLIARDGQLANETEAGHGEPWDSEGDGWSDKDEDELSVSELGLGDKGDHSRFLVAVSVGPDGSVKLTANGVTQLLPPGVVDVDDDTVADAWRKVIGTILGDVPPALSA